MRGLCFAPSKPSVNRYAICNGCYYVNLKACMVTQIIGKCNHARPISTPILHQQRTYVLFGALGGLGKYRTGAVF